MNKTTVVLVAAALAGAGYVGVNYYVNDQIEQAITQKIAGFEADTGLDVDFASSSVDLLTRDVEITQLQISSLAQSAPELTIDKLSIAGYEQDKISPLTELEFVGIKLNSKADVFSQGTSPELLAATYHVKTSFSFDEASGDSEFALMVLADEVAQGDFTISLGNSKKLMEVSLAASKLDSQTLSLEQELQLQSQLMAAMQSLQFKSLALTINNQGTLSEFIESEVAQQGMTLADFRAAVAQQLQMMFLPHEVQQAINDFALGMNALSLSITSTHNQNFMALSQQLPVAMSQDPELLAELIKVEANGK
ncbi:hypothetical protein [Pseudoalteromonas sp. PS5]|uniref:hypothetical protein n=1 Tax=Pseudoalteromonas sp. PS5 TaxID=1437473 RepID=UPI000FFE6F9E|nr:hypothetical protein [Pseudoalteromonas sp. PS5]RXE94975.1 hypothetical protein D9603_21150 [Pseudoalteromonas sp. PS5]